ncbi:hypothetical protein QJS10_CPA10g00095 [Acorus calamus]|uniref:Xaa-Pro dipeptidyl-peptidase-like domain-containing protein n=1 Tax=Acorus calamus TaxID=4465 RepID=A0AAV9E1L4_ACOCL|nr:hypothetical protein QJS10_CPA10g00095 [Acorus calamus]
MGTSAESQTVETGDGVKLHVRLFRPSSSSDRVRNLVVVLVHPFTVLGGCQALLKGIALGLAGRGYVAVTFDMRGAGRSSGRASLTGFAEVRDVVAVCDWVAESLSPDGIVLVGSSAGAPIAGSSVDKSTKWSRMSLGYPFGFMSSILFGRHYPAILKSQKPKLFVMGTRDGFTSVKQLENKLRSAEGRVETRLLEGVSHFQMEGPEYDARMTDLISEFIESL